MIAIDTSVFVAYFQGSKNAATEQVDALLQNNNVVLLPVVLAELLSDPTLPREIADNIAALPMLDIKPGYWIRAGKTRAKILAKKRKALLTDTLIAQACIDHNIPLLTNDRDFANFADFCGLKLID